MNNKKVKKLIAEIRRRIKKEFKTIAVYTTEEELEKQKKDKNYKIEIYSARHIMDSYYKGGGTGTFSDATYSYVRVRIPNPKAAKILKLLDALEEEINKEVSDAHHAE